MEYSSVFLSGLRSRPSCQPAKPTDLFLPNDPSTPSPVTLVDMSNLSVQEPVTLLCTTHDVRRCSGLCSESSGLDSEDITFTSHESLHFRRLRPVTMKPLLPLCGEGAALPVASTRSVPRTVLRPRSYTDSLPPRTPPPMRPLPSSPAPLNLTHQT